MKPRPIIYWIATAIIAFVFISGGAAGVARPPSVMQGMLHLGYPPYFMLILGTWKFLGGVIILLPGTKLLKEWAYAGMLFDLTGASASHAAVGDPVVHIIVPLIILIILAISWALRPPSRTLLAGRSKPLMPAAM